MDLPAYGLTGPFMDRNYSTQHYVAFIAAFLQELGVKHCVLGWKFFGWENCLEFYECLSRSGRSPNFNRRLWLFQRVLSSVPIAFQLAQLPVVKQLFTFITPRFVAASSVKNVYADPQKVAQEVIDRYFELTLRSGNRQAFVDKLNTPSNSFF